MCNAITKFIFLGLVSGGLLWSSQAVAQELSPQELQEQEEVERLYAWLDGVYAHMASRGVAPTTIAQALAAANAG